MPWKESAVLSSHIVLAVRCVHCSIINYTIIHDTDDASAVDPQGVTCWSCGEDSLLEGEMEISDPQEDEQVMLDDGYKKISWEDGSPFPETA